MIAGSILSACAPAPAQEEVIAPKEPEQEELAQVPLPTATAVPPTETPTKTKIPPTITPTEAPLTLRDFAEKVAEGVGFVEDVYEGDPDRVIYLFKENHAALIGQVEIAIMVNRLYAHYNMRELAIEGYASTEPPLDLSWAHRLPPYIPGEPITDREDVLSTMLAEGEVNSAEFLGLVYEDVTVYGIDNAELYAIDVEPVVYNAPFIYLYYIAIAFMDDQELNLWNGYMDQERYQEAYEFALSTDSYTAEMNERFGVGSDNSVEEVVVLYEEIQAYANENEVDIPPDLVTDMELLFDQMDIVIQRSEAMVENILALAETIELQGPIAVFAGAAHASHMAELLEDRGVSLVLIDALSREEGLEGGMLPVEAYMRKIAGQSIGGEGTIGSLLDDRKKPGPTAQKERTRIEEMLREIFQKLARTAYELFGDDRVTVTDEESQRIIRTAYSDKAFLAAMDELRNMGFKIEVWSYYDSNHDWTGLEGPHAGVGLRLTFPNGHIEHMNILFKVTSGGGKGSSPVNLEELLKSIREYLITEAKITKGEEVSDYVDPLASEVPKWNQNCSQTWYQFSTEQ